MKTKINIAEILKDKPQGIKLYNWLYNTNVELDTINTTDEETIIWCTKKKDINTTTYFSFSKLGTMIECLDGLQILLPSREMRDWSKFAWKKGDVLVHKDGDVHIIFEGFVDDTYCVFAGKYYLWKENNNTEQFYEEERLLTSDFQKAGKDAAQAYINTIEKKLGGKLNRETLEIEKTQPEFKDGDIVYADYGHKQAVFIVSGKTDLSEGYNSFIALDLRGLTLDMGCMSFFKEDLCKLRLATEEEKKQLFDALAKEGKAWDREKKDIVDLKPKVELKPFDKVLVRDGNTRKWEADLFGFKSDTGLYHCVGGSWSRCIPYEGNEHLLGTTKDVED